MNILVTDFDNSGDVMIFTDHLTVETVTETLNGKELEYNEIYEVKDEDLQYYIYEPCYMYNNKNQA